MEGIKVSISDLGPLRQAEFEPGRFTIVCGENNTGKTYATYTLFGFLQFWHKAFSLPIPEREVEALIEQGTVSLNLDGLLKRAEFFLETASEQYSRQLAGIFAGESGAFVQAKARVTVAREHIKPLSAFQKQVDFGEAKLIGIVLEPGEREIVFSLLGDKKKLPHRIFIQHLMGSAVKTILFDDVLPRPFIASVERTGAAIFRIELDITRNRLLETMASQGGKDLDPFELLGKAYSSYALPVKENVDFARELERISKETSVVGLEHPAILERFQEIVGGHFVVREGSPAFVPARLKRLKLGINESSSSVRSLLHLGFYLRHLARPGDLLMIDEPELNLHPKNQRRMARLLAMLCHAGVHLFITTHSDYIIRELNTLLLLHRETPRLREIGEKYGYQNEERIAPEAIRLFLSGDQAVLLPENKYKTKIKTLTPIPVDRKHGIAVSSFDESIDEMNQIQDEILFGGEEDDP